MRILGDYHTHTPYSHGKNSILENAQIAKKKGLKQIAITDHGFLHRYFNVDREKFDQMRTECEDAEKITGVKVLLGIEANLLSLDGNIDITPKEYEKMDILLMGWHNFVKTKGFKNKFCFFFLNYIFNIFGTPKWKKNSNTKAYLKAIEKYPIDVITHLNYGMKVNTLEVARFARDHGVLIELNGKRIKFSDEEIKQMVKEKVKFILGSDAHSSDRVGENDLGVNLITRLQIPQELVVNLDKIPKFKKFN